MSQHKRKQTQAIYILRFREHESSTQKHLDIWCDGRIYPKNPLTNSTPCFSTPPSLLRFTDDGHQELLGYCNALSSHASSLKYLYKMLCHETSMLKSQNYNLISELQKKDQSIYILEKKVRELCRKKTKIGERERERKISNVETLKCGSGGLKRRI